MSSVLVAKSYQKLPFVGDPYMIGTKTYVKVQLGNGNIKQVKVYTPAEYKKYYGEDVVIDHSSDPYYKSQKDILGFTDGYITIFKGSAYEQKEWFKENGAVYRKWWGWSLASGVEVPSDLPMGVEPVRLEWSAVGADNENLKPEDQVKAVCDKLLNDPDTSEYQGAVGDSITVTITVEKNITLNGYYGTQHMMIFRDENNNCYVWTTAARSWEEGSTRTIRGQVKAHKDYKGVSQTVLTRCKEITK